MLPALIPLRKKLPDLAAVGLFQYDAERELARRLGFPLRSMNPGVVPLFPQPLPSGWWVDVYHDGQKPPNLPARASLRWEIAREYGLRGTTLVYYEPLPMRREESRVSKALRHAHLWLAQEFPIWRSHVQSSIRATGRVSGEYLRTTLPIIGEWMQGLVALVMAVALIMFAIATIIAAIHMVLGLAMVMLFAGVLMADPVLVIVDAETGTWWEIDRWDD